MVSQYLLSDAMGAISMGKEPFQSMDGPLKTFHLINPIQTHGCSGALLFGNFSDGHIPHAKVSSMHFFLYGELVPDSGN